MANARDAGRAAEAPGRLFASSGLSLAGAALAVSGAALAYGIMAARALRDGFDYTAESWALIAPIWGLLALLAALVPRRRIAALPLGWLAIFAGFFFADVFGWIPAAGLFLFATVAVFSAPAPVQPEETHDLAAYGDW